MGASAGLRRSRKHRWIAGVCGGIAERFDIPANVVRPLYVVVSLLSSAFPGALFYLILCICVPQEELAPRTADGPEEDFAYDGEASHLSRSAALGLAAVLGVLGAHRFYAGKIGTGLLMVLTLGGLGIWWLVDLVLVATGEFRDSEGRRLVFWEGEDAEDESFFDVPGSVASGPEGVRVDSAQSPLPTWDRDGTGPERRSLLRR
jgi:phage shock protein PspC (stress-responsive transcriptional regulator)